MWQSPRESPDLCTPFPIPLTDIFELKYQCQATARIKTKNIYGYLSRSIFL